MDLKVTFTRARVARQTGGYTLVEVLVVMPTAILCLAALLATTLFISRSFHALSNYSDLSAKNRLAENTLLREIRQAIRVDGFSSNSLALIDGTGATISYVYDAGQKTLTRTGNGVSTILLTGCDRFQFTLGERNPQGGSYDVYPSATAATAKVVDLSWSCSRQIKGIQQNSESIQTARIVIRKQDI